MHVAHLGFCRDEVHRNAHGFFGGQVNVQRIPDLVQSLLCQAVFLRVQMPDIIGKRCLEGNAVPAALNGKIEMVGQRIGQVRAQGTVQLVLRVGGNVVRQQEHLARDVAQQCKILLVHIVEGALHRREIGELIRHGGEADALAEHHQFAAFCVPCQSNVVVDLFENLHLRHAPSAKFTKKKLPLWLYLHHTP